MNETSAPGTKSEKKKPRTQNIEQNNITLDFSIKYITTYGQELYVNMDDYTCKKLIWCDGHVWRGRFILFKPRKITWTYTVVENDRIIRREEMIRQRTYELDDTHKYYHIFDQWDNPRSSVSPLTFGSQIDLGSIPTTSNRTETNTVMSPRIKVHRPRLSKDMHEIA